jgi:hypothetical protein
MFTLFIFSNTVFIHFFIRAAKMENKKQDFLELDNEAVRISVPYGTHIDISFELVTPAMAENWLNTNADNQRAANTAHISQYAREMTEGNWYHDTGDCIRFSNKGTLIDGQHRLRGLILSKKSVMMMIMRNINAEHISAMDIGKRRNLRDILKVNGIKPPTGISESALSALTSSLWYLADFSRKAHSVNKTFRMDDISNSRKPTPLELYKFLELNIHFLEHLSLLSDMKVASFVKRGFTSGNLMGWYCVSLIDRDIADTIFKSLRDGIPHSSLGHDCPSMKLMQYIKNCKDLKTPIRTTTYPALWLWCYEHMFDNKKPRHLKLSYANMPCQGHNGSKLLREKLDNIRFK